MHSAWGKIPIQENGLSGTGNIDESMWPCNTMVKWTSSAKKCHVFLDVTPGLLYCLPADCQTWNVALFECTARWCLQICFRIAWFSLNSIFITRSLLGHLCKRLSLWKPFTKNWISDGDAISFRLHSDSRTGASLSENAWLCWSPDCVSPLLLSSSSAVMALVTCESV